jgi:aconitate hydratase
VASLGLTGTEIFSVIGLNDDLQPNSEVPVRAIRSDGSELLFEALVRIDTPIEVTYYRNGGILHSVLRKMLRD